jgi:hypothetical protein
MGFFVAQFPAAKESPDQNYQTLPNKPSMGVAGSSTPDSYTTPTPGTKICASPIIIKPKKKKTVRDNFSFYTVFIFHPYKYDEN